MNRVPFQCQMRAFVPPVGLQGPSLARQMGNVSRMSDPTAARAATKPPWYPFGTSCHAPPVNLMTAHPLFGKHVPRANVPP